MTPDEWVIVLQWVQDQGFQVLYEDRSSGLITIQVPSLGEEV